MGSLIERACAATGCEGGRARARFTLAASAAASGVRRSTELHRNQVIKMPASGIMANCTKRDRREMTHTA